MYTQTPKSTSDCDDNTNNAKILTYNVQHRNISFTKSNAFTTHVKGRLCVSSFVWYLRDVDIE